MMKISDLPAVYLGYHWGYWYNSIDFTLHIIIVANDKLCKKKTIICDHDITLDMIDDSKLFSEVLEPHLIEMIKEANNGRLQ